ncbi:hypothetical protein AMECASPLE_001929 [Ameca splendens]|uniref:Uncharacterized protein n=1 Tax=Ameca splendens TaxID=208324 RepID=A0ABV0Z7Y9_9TELE
MAAINESTLELFTVTYSTGAVLHSSVPGYHDSATVGMKEQYQDTDVMEVKWNSSSIAFIVYTRFSFFFWQYCLLCWQKLMSARLYKRGELKWQKYLQTMLVCMRKSSRFHPRHKETA